MGITYDQSQLSVNRTLESKYEVTKDDDLPFKHASISSYQELADMA